MDNNYNQDNYQNNYQDNYQNNQQSNYEINQNMSQSQSSDPYIELSNMMPNSYVPQTEPAKKGSALVILVFILGSLAGLGGCIWAIMQVFEWIKGFGPL